MGKYKFTLASLLSGFLLALPWISGFPSVVLLVALLPLLWVENQLYFRKTEYRPAAAFHYTFLSFGFWNLIAFWWLAHASWIGLLAAVVINGFFMTIPIFLAHIGKRRIGLRFGDACLVFFWLAFEYVQNFWAFSFPVLNLGNGFFNTTSWVQWYEYTGILGGSAWILLVNISIFRLFLYISKTKTLKGYIVQLLLLVLLVVLPVIFSFRLRASVQEKEKTLDVVVVQPNIDPYTEKYDIAKVRQHFQLFEKLATQKADQQVDFFVFPETAITRDHEIIWEEDFFQAKSVNFLRKWKAKYPAAGLVVGLNTFRHATPGQAGKPEVRKAANRDQYYIAYNTAAYIDSTQRKQFSHKSKLVLGVERMPFARLLPALGNLTVDLGGTTGTLGTDSQRHLFYPADSSLRIAPLICFESVYGGFVADFVRQGANLIFVITNDGWWGNTPGYRLHLKFSQLRAIENRRCVVRSANTGISCIISPTGEISHATPYGQKATIRAKVSPRNKKTYYSRAGDYLGRIAAFFAVILLLYIVVYHIIPKSKIQK